MGSVDGHVPQHVGSLHEVSADFELDTGVLHVHVVHQLGGGLALAHCKRTVVDHVLGLLDEEIGIDREPVEESRLESGIEVVGLLPGDVGSGAEDLHDRSLAVDSLD